MHWKSIDGEWSQLDLGNDIREINETYQESNLYDKPTMYGMETRAIDELSGRGAVKNGYRYNSRTLFSNTKLAYLSKFSVVGNGFTEDTFPYFPAVPETFQASSSSALDAPGGGGGTSIVTSGFSDTETVLFNLFFLNGQNPVSGLGNPLMYRANVATLLTSEDNTTIGGCNKGFIYIYPTGTPVTAGVPDDLNDCIVIMEPGEGFGSSGSFYVPPSWQMYWSNLSMTMNPRGKESSMRLCLFSRTGLSGWRCLFQIGASTGSGNIDAEPWGFTNSNQDPFQFLTGGDNLMVIKRLTGQVNDVDVEVSMYLSGVALIPEP
jgi:hypothetical protein